MRQNVLVIDDDTALREMMALTLKKEGYEVLTAGSAGEARSVLSGSAFDLVVSDIYLGDGTGIELLEDIKSAGANTAIILVTAQGTIETAAAAREAGVFDYLAKPFQVDELVKCVAAALKKTPSPSTAPASGPETMIIGSHPSIVDVYKAITRVAPLPIPVLLRGETGTGKELVALALHRFGQYSNGPFVPVNCGAIPESLLESELFGHKKGAFTGAVRDHLGAIQTAREGTLILDEVGELPTQLQVKLLRFLQEGEVRPLGSDTTLHIQTRVISATHQDLSRGIAAGGFREDFFYRLAAYQIEIPPLRSRVEDIQLLVEHFLQSAKKRLGQSDLGGVSRATISVLERHPWPGNVRELESLVQRCLIDYGSLEDARKVQSHLETSRHRDSESDSVPAIGDDLTLEELERLHVEAVLKKAEGNRTRAAEILGIERKSLYRKINRLGIPVPGDP